jgi:hypothetical protein
MPRIIIDIPLDGEITVEAEGFQGRQCKDATKAIEQALGTTTKDVNKPEFSQLTGHKTAREARQW